MRLKRQHTLTCTHKTTVLMEANEGEGGAEERMEAPEKTGGSSDGGGHGQDK